MKAATGFDSLSILRLTLLVLGAVLGMNVSVCGADSLILQTVEVSSLPGDRLQLMFNLSGPAREPRIFHTDNPARIALDLPGVANGLEKKSIPINIGAAQGLQAVESAGRTRVVVNLLNSLPYSTRVEGNHIVLVLKNGNAASTEAPSTGEPEFRPVSTPPTGKVTGIVGRRINTVDFRRGERGEGRLLIGLSDPKSLVDIHEEGRKIMIRLPGTELPAKLNRKMDVMDFATPVKSIESAMDGNQARITIIPISDDYDYSSYQTGNVVTVELRPLTQVEKEEIKKKSFAYRGEKLTLNFQDIPVRSVLQILADFTNLNIVASDTVQGNVTLRLEDVPWDQALDLVLKSKQLGKRQEGNIVRVAPLSEIHKLEKEELEDMKTVEELEPLRTELIQINYTKAEDIQKVLQGTRKKDPSAPKDYQEGNDTGLNGTLVVLRDNPQTSTSGGTEVNPSILSARGNVTVDPRTNQLIVKDTPRNLDRIRDLISKLDIPVRQVLIESRIVIANNDFTRELGSRLSLNRSSFVQSRRGKSFTQIENDVNGNPTTQDFRETYAGNSTQSYDALVDLASTAAAASGGAFGATLLKAGDYLLDLELSAAQIEGRGEVVSTPRLVTADQTKAIIKQGVQIPYQSVSSVGGGATARIQYKEAVLQLEVTPHITPDDNVLMDLSIRKDAPGQQTPVGLAIDTRSIDTTAQVGNGETVVLGGVFEGTQTNSTDKVPFLGDLPGIGFMFRRNKVIDNKRELLIFITPKVISPNMAVR